MKQLNEGLQYRDFEGQVQSKLSIDEYSAKMGDDDEIITISFKVKGEMVGNDLVEWLEKGYNWILDAQLSEGELTTGIYVVFAEMNRRTSAPSRIIEMLEDLETLTAISLGEWTVIVDDVEYPADKKTLSKVIPTSPQQYRVTKESGIDELRVLSGAEPIKKFKSQSPELKAFKSLAGL